MKKISLSIILFFIGICICNITFAEKYRYNSNNNNNKSLNSTTAGCAMATGSTELDLNNVRALIHTGGDMWWDLVNGTSGAKYEVPNGSGKMSLFAGAIWIGGTDVNGQLRLCALRFRDSGTDYWPGPLISRNGPEKASVTSDICAKYDKHFVITRNEVSEYRAWYNTPDSLKSVLYPNYSTPNIIKDWPAHGDVAAGYEYNLAPFKDVDNDGFYNYNNGDYPFFDLDGELPCGTNLRSERLYGDKTLWWVYNDKGNIHTESGGNAIGMEIRAQAFAFSTNDELNNMTFYNYVIINRSTFTLQDTYFGIWTDADLGEATDDYVGCDVARGLGYVYNGDEMDGDGNNRSYGVQPPACGLDFFEGPYMDPDGLNNPKGSAYCDASINGLNFYDTDPNIPEVDKNLAIDDERWGMRRFIYFNNASGAMGDPSTAVDYYNYLRGFWKDNTPLRFGGTGHSASGTVSDFMFPGYPTTDPCGWGTGGVQMGDWSEKLENNQVGDRRFVQSAGPFTLEPGARNDVTVGVVWARATSGGAWGSVMAMQKADEKAQKLFENCFKVVDGPDAPELNIIELDKKFIFHIYNLKGSNNYENIPEDYVGKDPFIVCPDNDANCDKEYKFEGYQVFQLKDESCSVNDIEDADKARLVFQCDIKNDASQLVNFEFNEELGGSTPIEKVNGQNKGIKHSFEILNDEFAKGDKRLVNHKTYYFVAIAYAYNQFKKYDPQDASSLDGQKKPYLSGRKGASGSIKTYSVIPHISNPRDNGTILNSTYGDGPKIIQLEGFGCGENALDLTQKTIDKIMAGYPWKADSVEYDNGKGPVEIKVVDPLNVVADDFVLKFDSVPSGNAGTNPYLGIIKKAKWVVYKKSDAGDPSKWIWSNSWISLTDIENEQLIPSWGISIKIKQVQQPGDDRSTEKNGFIEATMEFTDPAKPWLSFMSDGEECDPFNWIRAGTLKDATNLTCADYYNNSIPFDKSEYFEQILEGAWTPYLMASKDNIVKNVDMDVYQAQKYGLSFFSSQALLKFATYRYPSIDLVITSDKSKWTRSPVVETCEYDTTGHVFGIGMSEGSQWKFALRKHSSVDKSGLVYATDTSSSNDENSPNYIGSTGMGWFPGYAIDVETGERLNIVFGEDSRYPGENGRDMLWNPTGNTATDLYWATGGSQGDILFGGKHYIYIFGHSLKDSTSSEFMPAYDAGKRFYKQLIKVTTNLDSKKRDIWKNAIWVSIPLVNPQYANNSSSSPYGFIKSDVKIRIRMANPYCKSINTFAKDSTLTQNNNLPLYLFSTQDMSATKNDLKTAQNSLNLIRVVPNPYYGYCEYEKSQTENKIKITNLPQKCTISIYNVGGTLVKRFKKDSPLSYQDWDLRNDYGISIASGVYIIHIDAPGIGEKILKWFGALRPLDLNSF